MSPEETSHCSSAVAELVDSLDPEEIEKADLKLRDLLEAVETTGSKGSITITVSIERKRPGVMVVRPKIAAKIPEESATASVRYLTRDGRLVEHDPAQMQFDFQEKVTPISESDAAEG